MNIFFLDTDAVKAAEMQCDKHAEVAVESVQMLVSTLRRHGATDNDVPLTEPVRRIEAATPTPSTRWAGVLPVALLACRPRYRLCRVHAPLRQRTRVPRPAL